LAHAALAGLAGPYRILEPLLGIGVYGTAYLALALLVARPTSSA
jgi:hypothetical protein